MCYEDSKPRTFKMKPVQANQPLIKEKKTFIEPKEKEN